MMGRARVPLLAGVVALVVGAVVVLGAGAASADPAPTVAPASATTTATTPVVLTPVVTGTGIDHALTCIVNGVSCVAPLVVPGEGTWAVNPTTGAVTFTAASGFSGTAGPRAYRVTDNALQTGEGLLNVTVNLPAAPVVTARVANVVGSTVSTVTPTVTNTTFLVNASTCVVDPADSVCKTTVVQAGVGTFVVSTSTRALTFTAVLGYLGAVAPVSYRVTDTYGRTASNTVTLTVTLPPAPVITPRTVTALGAAATTVTPTVTPTTFLVSNQTCVVDPLDSVCKTTVVEPGVGTFVVNTSTRALTFTAVLGYTGPVTPVTYRVTDGYGRTTSVSSANVSVTAGLPLAPIVAARVQNVTGATATIVTPTITNGSLLVHASTCVVDPADTVCKATVVVPGQGTFAVRASDSRLTFTAAAGFTGAVSPVTYRVINAYSQTSQNTVTLTVLTPAAPVVSPRSISIVGATSTTVTPTVANAGFLVNASTCVINPTTLVCQTSVVLAGVGTFTVTTSNRTLTFVPAATYLGPVDPVTYRVVDAYGQSSEAAVTVTVTAPAVPVVTPRTLTVTGTTSTTATPTVAPTTFLTSALTCVINPNTLVCATSVVLSGVGTFTVNTSSRALTFVAASGFTGVVPDVTYRVTDRYGQSGQGAVSITVVAPAAPTVTATSVNPVATAAASVTPTATGTGLVASLTRVQDPADSGWKTTVTVPGQGTWVVNTSTRALTFTAALGFSGAATPIAYRVADAYGATGQASISATVAAPAVPAVTAAAPSSAYLVAAVVTPAATPTTFLVNASTCIVDPADSQCKTSVTLPAQGTWVVNTTTRAATFTPLATFAGTTTAVTYRVMDAYGQSSGGTANLTATIAAPAAPSVGAGLQRTGQGTPVALWPDPVGTGIAVADGCVVDPADSQCRAVVTVSGEGTWAVAGEHVLFSPLPAFAGVSAVTFRVTDVVGQQAGTTLTVTVVAPVAPVLTGFTAGDGSAVVTFTAAPAFEAEPVAYYEVSVSGAWVNPIEGSPQWLQLESVGPGNEDVTDSFSIEGLSGVAQVRLRAVYENGWMGPASAALTVLAPVVADVLDVPGAPTLSSATWSGGVLTVTFTPGSGGVVGEHWIRIGQSSSAASPWILVTPSQNASPITMTISPAGYGDGSLASFVGQNLRLRAANAAGSSQAPGYVTITSGE
jgi:CshA-type fibril repeat protein